MAPKTALPNLTTVRLLAAIYVFCYHSLPSTHAELGYTGVNLFFTLSGFILAYNHPTVTDNRKFLASRLARIYPLYALSLLLCLPQFAYSHRHYAVALLAGIPLSFALLQTWWPPLRFSLNYAGWTLPVELFFYFCFPFLIDPVRIAVTRWKIWIGVCAALLVAPTAFTYFVVMPAWPGHEDALKGLLNLPLFHLGEFVIGMFLGIRFLEKRPIFRGWHVLLATLLLVASSALVRPIPNFYKEMVLDGMLAVPYAVLIYTLAGWRSRWFGHPLLQLGGEISFGIYLLQFPVGEVLERLWRHPGPAFGPVLFLLTAAAAYFCYVWVEKPARRFILSSLGYHPSPKPIPTPGLQT